MMIQRDFYAHSVDTTPQTNILFNKNNNFCILIDKKCKF